MNPDQPRQRAIIYARYSSDSQRDASVEDQIRICVELIERHGWLAGEVFIDRALSGASSLRPGYQALLRAARDGECDIVVAEALDRLSRDQADIAAGVPAAQICRRPDFDGGRG